VLLPVSVGVLEPHALIRATIATRATAARGRSFLLIAFSPAELLWLMPPSQGDRVLQGRICFSICRRYVRAASMEGMRVLIVEDEPYMAEAIRDGLRLEAIAADVAADGDAALELLSVNGYDIAVLDRDIPGPSGDEIAERIVASASGLPILMLTAADRLDDKATGFGLGADDYLTKPFELGELVLRLRALDRRRAYNRPPVREIAGLRLDPFRREVYRDGRYVALTRKQFAVLDVLIAADGGVVSAEELLSRAWDENADPFTNAVRITVSALRKRLGEPPIIATIAGVGYRIDPGANAGGKGGEGG
jgi:two-component system response regulator VanR